MKASKVDRPYEKDKDDGDSLGRWDSPLGSFSGSVVDGIQSRRGLWLVLLLLAALYVIARLLLFL